MGKKIIINESILRSFLYEMAKERILLKEISANDAYTRFYADKIPEEQYRKVMTGAPTMTKLHKRVLDIIALTGWDEEMVTYLVKLWTTGSNDAKAYAIDMMPDSKLSNTPNSDGRSWNAVQMVNFLKRTLNMRTHTEGGFVKNGLYTILSNDDVLITCTTSYAASTKYYGDSHWCTASDLGGKFNGFKMFGDYVGLSDDTYHERSILVQMVDKHDRNNSIQMAVTEDDEIDSACWFDDKPVRDDGAFDNRCGLYEYLKKFGFNSIKDFLSDELLSRLLQQTEKCYEEEAPYWEKRSEQIFTKRKNKFVENCKNGYDEAILPMLREMGNDDTWGINFSSSYNVYPSFNVTEEAKTGSIVALQVRFLGINKDEREWIEQLYTNDDSGLENGFDHEIWFMNMSSGQLLNKVKGSITYQLRNTLEISECNPRLDWAGSSKDSLYSFDGKLLVADFEPATHIMGYGGTLTGQTENGNHVVYFLEPVKKTGYFYLSMLDVDNCKYLGHADLDNLPLSDGLKGIRGWMRIIDPKTGRAAIENKQN